jgi:DnaJ like chaperone protein
MLYGKITAAALGLLLFGLPGLLLGLVVGHWFDRGLQHSLGFGSPAQVALIQQSFFKTSFQLLGLIAKADGRVSEQEVAHTEEIMRQLGLGEEQRREAIALFKQGTEPDFEFQSVVSEFSQLCQGQRQVKHTLLACLVSLALVDGHLQRAELEFLEEIAGYLGHSPQEFARLVKMMEAQSHFHSAGTGATTAAGQLTDAYLALGVEADCSDRELKQAYRRLMSENHPDKLIAQGVPEEMIKLGTERAQDIQAAYELVKKDRGLRR